MKERAHWRLIDSGEGVHWPDRDEGFRFRWRPVGRPSGESQTPEVARVSGSRRLTSVGPDERAMGARCARDGLVRSQVNFAR